jgi:hypothetical protein
MFTDQSQEAKMPVLFIPGEDVRMIIPAIRFIYGFNFPEKPKHFTMSRELLRSRQSTRLRISLCGQPKPPTIFWPDA